MVRRAPQRPARPVPKPTSLSSGRGRHLGMSTPGHIPKGRGFQESLVYFEGAEDHNTQRSCQDPECIIPIPANASSPYDLWVDDGPATALAGVEHSGFLFGRTAVGYVQALNTSNGPMFMHLAPASSHTPLEPPPRPLALGWLRRPRRRPLVPDPQGCPVGSTAPAFRREQLTPSSSPATLARPERAAAC